MNVKSNQVIQGTKNETMNYIKTSIEVASLASDSYN